MINLEHFELSGLGDLGVGASSLEAPGLHDTNLNTLSTLTPRDQELLGHIKMMAVFFFTAHEKGFKFHAQPQTGAYSCCPKGANKNNRVIVIHFPTCTQADDQISA